MSLYDKIISGEEKIALVGLGYVGMPIAVAFAKKVKVVGFDLNEAKNHLDASPNNDKGNSKNNKDADSRKNSQRHIHPAGELNTGAIEKLSQQIIKFKVHKVTSYKKFDGPRRARQRGKERREK